MILKSDPDIRTTLNRIQHDSTALVNGDMRVWVQIGVPIGQQDWWCLADWH